jgi:hypothetical protein
MKIDIGHHNSTGALAEGLLAGESSASNRVKNL